MCLDEMGPITEVFIRCARRDGAAHIESRISRMISRCLFPTRRALSPRQVVTLALIAAAIVPSRYAEAQQRGSFLTSGSDNTSQHLLGPTGRACVSIKTNARADLVMPGSFQHFVEATNSCIRLVAVKICYKGRSLGCRELRLRPNAPGETTMLGVMAGVPKFDIEYSDRFLP